VDASQGEEEAAGSANGDDENAARRRLGAEICGEFLARDTCRMSEVSLRLKQEADRRGAKEDGETAASIIDAIRSH
jgi:hypothetical protein